MYKYRLKGSTYFRYMSLLKKIVVVNELGVLYEVDGDYDPTESMEVEDESIFADVSLSELI
jgi:hypothetical protein